MGGALCPGEALCPMLLYTVNKQTLQTVRVIMRKLLVIVVEENIVQTCVGSKMQRVNFVGKVATLNQSVNRQTNHKMNFFERT